ncbi:MAG: branched-chain amino acid ABC transporter permease [Vallitaleaceae bacterium]|nr:branched-chain amino acid ABC transporter permease [Vallitaleaceae bacterium]
MKMRIIKNKNFLLSYFGVMSVLLIVPVFIERQFSVHVLILCVIWSIMSVGWNFIGGYAGQVSNGHAMYFAIGAYVSGLFIMWFEMTPWISMWIAIAISMLVAYIFGLPLLRLRGHYFAIATMALVEVTRIIFLNWKLIGGSTGISYFNKKLPELYSLQFIEKKPFYYICLLFLGLTIILSKLVQTSKFGYYLRAIKANQEAAESSGVNAAKYKRWAYMISAAVVCIAGVLYAQYIQYLDPMMLLPLSNSMLIVLAAVMGGIGTIWGPVLGAFVMISINEYARSYFALYSGLNLVVYGILVIIIVLFLPNGLISLIKKRNVKLPKKEGGAEA